MSQLSVASDLKYLRFDREAEEHQQLVPSLVQCYQQVFAEAPWNEWKKCPKCNRHWGILDEAELSARNFTCEDCEVKLKDFWPTEEVAKDLVEAATDFPERDMKASFWVLVHGEQVVGFCGGFSIKYPDLLAKLECPDLDGLFTGRFGSHSLVAYQSELGLLPGYRNKGAFGHKDIARELLQLRHEDFVSMGLRIGLIRAKAKQGEESVTYKWYTNPSLNFETVGNYNDSDGRVVLARDYEGLSWRR